jgi:hypothetical protein
MRHAISFQIAAPWSSCLSSYFDIAGVWDVGLQPLSRKSRLREFMLGLRSFNLRMQALRRTRQCAPILAKVHRRLTTPGGRPPISLGDATARVSCLVFVATRRKTMIKKVKIALIATVALVGLASPALPRPFDENEGTGDLLPFNSHRVAPENASLHAVVHSARRHGLNSFAMEPRARSDFNSHPYNAPRAPAFDPRDTSAYPFGPGINFPYPDRPYGDPDHW